VANQISTLHLIGTGLRQQIASPSGLRLFMLHSVISVSVAICAWPQQICLTRNVPPLALVFWLQTESMVLSYIAMCKGAQLWGPLTEPAISDWVNFTDLGAARIVLARVTACLIYCLFLLATTFPAAIMLHSFSLVAPSYLSPLLLLLSLWVTGAALTGICWYLCIQSRGLRKLSVNLTFFLVTAGTIILAAGDETSGPAGRLLHSIVQLNPVFTINQLLVDEIDPSVYDMGIGWNQIQAALSKAGINALLWSLIIMVAFAISVVLTRRQSINSHLTETEGHRPHA